MKKQFKPGTPDYIAAYPLNSGAAALIIDMDVDGEWIKACLAIVTSEGEIHSTPRTYKAHSLRDGGVGFRMRGIRYNSNDFAVKGLY